ncbi:ATP-binding protein [Treponema sp.]|uniref:ATP-binding protein n=1 Tax=Treponema sp. TaxID=166 RepID=UPI00388E07AA
MEYEGLEIQEAVPEAASMIETFRAIGYSLETAVADIIDNSITAGASHITIQRYWRGGKSVITIKDNGCGMSNEELVHAMRPGAQNPLEERDEKDLGRFGLGLKTASFSQCRKLSVLSKKDNKLSYWTWDLDYVALCKKWNLVHWIPDEFKDALDDTESGTIVIWSDLDRILPVNTAQNNEVMKERFSRSLEKVRSHISMTFHRFIEDKTLSVVWGSQVVPPWNPFCRDECKLQPFSKDQLPGNVTMRGFVLPHKANFSTESAYLAAEGPKGWSGQQGFYVYRGKRLLLAGDWLGLFRKEEHYKLARIMIDLPNTQDAEWQIDIKKSKAYPPAVCREQIEQYAKQVRSTAEQVFRHRGKILKQRAGTEFYPLWLEKKKDNNWSYVINRQNPVIDHIKQLATTNPNEAIEGLLKLVEATVPTKTIFINESKDEDKQEPTIAMDTTLVEQTIKNMFDSFLSQGNTPAQAKALLKLVEPFNYYEDLIESL